MFRKLAVLTAVATAVAFGDSSFAFAATKTANITVSAGRRPRADSGRWQWFRLREARASTYILFGKPASIHLG